MKSNTEEHRAYVRATFPDAFELFYAILEGTVDDVRNRLDAGDNPNAVSTLGTTPIYCATQFSSKLDIAELLFSAGAVINCWDNYGRHPLHHNNRDVACVEWLLSHGADPNASLQSAREKWMHPIGSTSLHIAAYFGLLPVTELLLKYDADPNRQSENGSTPLHIAVSRYIIYKRLVRTLIDAGAEVNTVNLVGDAPLHELASNLGRYAYPVTRLLLFRGAHANTRNASGLLPSELLPDTAQGNRIKSLLIRYLSKSAE